MPFVLRSYRMSPIGRLRDTEIIQRFAPKEKALAAARIALLSTQGSGKVAFNYDQDLWRVQKRGETSRLHLELIGHFGRAISVRNFELNIDEA
jgi:hypothetical protein